MNEHEPLTPEERALAERLRLGPQAAPSPALDAAVLAAARAALGDGGKLGAGAAGAAQPGVAEVRPSAAARAAPRPRLRRWSATMGVAASLALAVGIAWQLRPLPPSLPQAAPVGMHDAAAEQRGDPGTDPAAAESAPAAEMPPSAGAARQARTEDPVREPVAAAPAPVEFRSPPKPLALPAPAAESAPAAAPQAFPEPAPAGTAVGPGERDPQSPAQQRERAATPARAAPAPALQRRQAPKSAALLAGANAPQGALARARGDDLSAPPPPPAAPAASAPAPAPTAAAIAEDAVEMTASAAADADADAHARLSPRQWLVRIRQQRDAGEREAARASLRLFRQQHPQARIPDDLRALLED